VEEKPDNKPAKEPIRIRPSLEAFHVPFREGEGNDDTITGKLPTWMMNRVDEAVYECREQIKSVISSRSELVRVAVYRLLNDLEPILKKKGFSNRMAKERAMMRLVKNKDADIKFYDDLSTVEECVERLAKRDAESEIRSILCEQLRLVAEIDDDYWRDRWLEDFERKFSHYIKRMKIALPRPKRKISMAPRDAEREDE